MFSCRHHFEISLKLSKIFSRVTFTNVETRSRNAVTSPCNTSTSCFTNCGFKNPPYLLNTTHIFTLFYLHNTCKSLNVHSRPLVSVFVVSFTSELLPQICSDKVATQTPPRRPREVIESSGSTHRHIRHDRSESPPFWILPFCDDSASSSPRDWPGRSVTPRIWLNVWCQLTA